MFVSMNWIKDFVDLDGFDMEQLIQRFTLSTAEVEGIELSHVRITRIRIICMCSK